MANPPTSLVDRQMIVDGVLLQEKKDLTKTLDDETGVEESHLCHMRVMTETINDVLLGDFSHKRVYTAKESITACTDDRGSYYFSHKRVYTAEHCFTFDNADDVEYDMEDWELENFKNEWEEKWNPSNGENLQNLLNSRSNTEVNLDPVALTTAKESARYMAELDSTNREHKSVQDRLDTEVRKKEEIESKPKTKGILTRFFKMMNPFA